MYVVEKLNIQFVNDYLSHLSELKCMSEKSEEIDLLVLMLESLLNDWQDLTKDVQVNNYAFRKMLVFLVYSRCFFIWSIFTCFQ